MRKIAFVTIVWIAVAIVIGGILLFNNLLSKEQNDTTGTTDGLVGTEKAPSSDLLPSMQELDNYENASEKNQGVILNNILSYMKINELTTIELPLSSGKKFQVIVTKQGSKNFSSISII